MPCDKFRPVHIKVKKLKKVMMLQSQDVEEIKEFKKLQKLFVNSRLISDPIIGAHWSCCELLNKRADRRVECMCLSYEHKKERILIILAIYKNLGSVTPAKRFSLI